MYKLPERNHSEKLKLPLWFNAANTPMFDGKKKKPFFMVSSLHFTTELNLDKLVQIYVLENLINRYQLISTYIMTYKP